MTRAPDIYEARARELAQQAGFDPDARVEKAGSGRGMPAWCRFRQAARAEHVAAEQAAMPKPAGVTDQDPHYANQRLEVMGNHEDNTIAQMQNCMRVGNVLRGVICADGHLGYAQPVGGVIAYQDMISISGVGYDIACGNMAVRLNTDFGSIKCRLPDILEQIQRRISFGVGRVNDSRVEHDLFDDKAWKTSGMEDYRHKARQQLGTVGSGNHYVDVFVETTWLDDPEFGGSLEDCPVWIGVHFGSRGLGHTTATRFLKMAGGQDGINVPPAVVSIDSDVGERYLAGMNLAGRYAYAGREWVVNQVRQIVGGEVTKTVHNHHNFAWQEQHGGKTAWVVRKGATPAFPGQEGFIGGSMGDDAVIVEGLESGLSRAALYSTVHGAGRNFGRKEAKRRFTRVEMDEWLARRNVLVAGGDLDESPMAYRRLPEVLAHHAGTIAIRHTLRPLVVAMAGSATSDPWKD